VLYNAEGGGQFALDAATGKFLWGRPFPYDVENVNMNFVDVKSGETRINFEQVHQVDESVTEACFHNTRNWWVASYSPVTNSQYIHFDDQCLHMVATSTAASGVGARYAIMRPGADPDHFSNLAKIDVATGEMRILRSSRVPAASATLSTAGGLVFTGDILGRYRALDHQTGAVLWEGTVGGHITQSNISYMADGKQYFMIYTGDSRGAETAVATPELLPAKPVIEFNAIYAFSLP
jgi:alcohol dehydrogenase (cytochrome c)